MRSSSGHTRTTTEKELSSEHSTSTDTSSYGAATQHDESPVLASANSAAPCSAGIQKEEMDPSVCTLNKSNDSPLPE